MLAWEKSVFGYPAKYVHFPEVVVQFARNGGNKCLENDFELAMEICKEMCGQETKRLHVI